MIVEIGFQFCSFTTNFAGENSINNINHRFNFLIQFCCVHHIYSREVQLLYCSIWWGWWSSRSFYKLLFLTFFLFLINLLLNFKTSIICINIGFIGIFFFMFLIRIKSCYLQLLTYTLKVIKLFLVYFYFSMINVVNDKLKISWIDTREIDEWRFLELIPER